MIRLKMTAGKKLFGVFGAMFFLSLALVATYVFSYRDSNRTLENVLQLYNRKLNIGSQVELFTTEMQGSQRGLMLSYAMQDPGASVQYTKLYADSGQKIDALMDELRPLLASDAERHAFDKIRQNRDEWSPRFEQLVKLCETGDIAGAYKLRNSNKVISASMHEAAKVLVTEQQKTIESLQPLQEASARRSAWTALFTILCSAALGLSPGRWFAGLRDSFGALSWSSTAERTMWLWPPVRSQHRASRSRMERPSRSRLWRRHPLRAVKCPPPCAGMPIEHKRPRS